MFAGWGFACSTGTEPHRLPASSPESPADRFGSRQRVIFVFSSTMLVAALRMSASDSSEYALSCRT